MCTKKKKISTNIETYYITVKLYKNYYDIQTCKIFIKFIRF